ncbi:putative membrane protein YhhN [Chitinophaga polysaccharea]|uniref:Putative membrane protein YhhN n=1 Tax=Chitinophaga polysaccharea TaxID=1293035 RepID=A0A561Q291_9BACT|nr:lysoplasmalogenase [Chitinophaga polysaccharea]TWF44460.1 putative membrane protein YhhN [Chitinophaga polysaccharea]
MFRTGSFIIYFLVLLVDILFIATDYASLRFLSKPLLMLLLIVYVLYVPVKIPRDYRIPLLLALFFSSIGDDLLLFSSLFLPGLGSFLLAHVMYIIFFLKIRYSNPPVPSCKYPLIFLHAAIIIFFILYLAPHLGNLAIPVIIYALTISVMVQSVLHAFHFRRQPAAWYCLIGALLFMFSDSLIAVGKFVHPLWGGDILVMLTYGIAQWGLVIGSTEYFAGKNRPLQVSPEGLIAP